jgi:hypothetical protein
MRFPSKGIDAPTACIRGSVRIRSFAASRAFRRVFDPGDDHYFVRLCLYRTLEVGDLAVWHNVTPRIDDSGRTEFLEQR